MTDLYSTRREALSAVLASSDTGDTITVCRRERGCSDDEICEMCARVTVTFGMTVDDLIEAAKEFRA